MDPIVYGLRQDFGDCVAFERHDFHGWSELHEQLNPLASPEFFLLDARGETQKRWLGVTDEADLRQALEAACAQ